MAALRVLITGGSSGLGAALAEHYRSQGAVVGITGRNATRLQEQAARGFSTYNVDAADAQAMHETARNFIAAHGLPDIVIANAGISIGTNAASAEDLTVLERTLRTNVCGVANTFQPFVELMCARRSGKLVGIASVAGIRGLAGGGAYSASKAAVATWMESLRLELRGSGVQALCIAPGYIDTPMTRVNPYRMPFLLPPEEAARRIARRINKGCAYAVVPWQMACVAVVLRLLPRFVYDRLFARAPRKPRNLPL